MLSSGGLRATTDGRRIYRAGRVDMDNLPIAETIVVNYLDDEATRMRERGELVGPWRPKLQGGIATGGCSFDIDCDDCDPCTKDSCDIAAGDAAGTGKCINLRYANGQGEAGCSDGVFCNGIETCQAVCADDGVTPCNNDGECTTGVCGAPVCEAPGTGTGTPSDLNYAVNNDGTCVRGACQGGLDHGDVCQFGAGHENDCRNGLCLTAICDEYQNRCTAPCTVTTCTDTSPNAGAVCTSDAECGTGGSCQTQAQMCDNGSACDGEETCNGTYCEPGTLFCGPNTLLLCVDRTCTSLLPNGEAKACVNDDDCTGLGFCASPGEAGYGRPKCPYGRCCTPDTSVPPVFTCSKTTQPKCQDPGESWAPIPQDELQDACPACPNYGSGIAPIGDFNVVIGPASNSACEGLSSIGDDYTFDTTSYINVENLVFVGGVETVLEERISFEFYDAGGNFIEDTFFVSGSGIALRRIQFDPPITIPPSGFVVARVASAFSPSGRIFWATTDAVDVGTNDAGSMWVNSYPPTADFVGTCVGGDNDGLWCNPGLGDADCPGGTCDGSTPDVLAFELSGGLFNTVDPTATPEGGCCDLAGGGCTQKLPWICRNTNGSFRGVGQACKYCSDDSFNIQGDCTLNGDFDCRLCEGDLDTHCLSDTDCTAVGGPCLPGHCIDPCLTGACCYGDGICLEQESAVCSGAGGAFQGNGTSCDPNCCNQPVNQGGADDCFFTQPYLLALPASGVCDGGPNDGATCTSSATCGGYLCSRVASVTITGDNSSASKEIFGSAGNTGCNAVQFNDERSRVEDVDPGWWEAFSIDDCAYVRMDLCCSVPLHAPQWVVMWDACPCSAGTQYFNVVNPNRPALPANARGAPFCEDDNLWWQYGPLRKGTYYQPIYSALAGAHGPYQMHIRAEACPKAACCHLQCSQSGATTCADTSECNGGIGEVCLNGFCILPCAVNEDCGVGNTCEPTCDLANILACQDVSGIFQGPPNRETANVVCDNDPVTGTCATGSCCLAGGVCRDSLTPDTGYVPVHKSDCDTLPNGVFIGGLLCAGGSCNGGTNNGGSCRSDDDCPGGGLGSCIARSGESLDQPSPCPICDIYDAPHCQVDNSQFTAPTIPLSDLCILDTCATGDPLTTQAIAVSDDFIADETGSVTTVCVKGIYANNRYANQPECSDLRPRRDRLFVVTIYEDDNGKPGQAVVPRQTSFTIASGIEGQFGGRNAWRYSLGLDTPIPLLQGRTYWLEVANNTDGKDENGDTDPNADPMCDWFYAHAIEDDPTNGNGLSYQNLGTTFETTDVYTIDMAWCIDVANSVPPVPVRACCTCASGGAGGIDPNCEALSADECLNTRQGTWVFDQLECAPGWVCPTSTPANDLCIDAQELFTGVEANWGNQCSSNSPAPLDEVDCNGNQTPISRDIWFTYTAIESADYRFGTCSRDPQEIDTVMEIYTDGTGTCICPTDLAHRVACNDDACPIAFDSPFGTAGSGIKMPVVAGVCYTIRVGGFLGDQGLGKILVEKDVRPVTAPDQVTPAPGTGNRYINFVAQANATGPAIEAIRVKFVSLDGFSLPTPDYLWVGEPFNAPDEDSSAPGQTFKVAPLTCVPVFRDWSTLGPIAVYGAEITPGSTYEVQRAFQSCGDLADEGCFSPPLEIVTGKFGDVAPVWAYELISPQPDFNDIAALVSKFLASPGAPKKSVCQLQPNIVFPDRAIDFRDIAADVQAFLGVSYGSAFLGPCACPSTVTCGVTACTSDLNCSGVSPDGGICIGGFCRDACGRCTP